jgi:hypothetical protein
MTRKQQIRLALQLIAPPTYRRAECRQDIELALSRIEGQAKAAHAFQTAASKKGRAQVARYAAALKRTRIAYNAIDKAISPWFSLAAAHIAGKPTLIDREIKVAEAFLNRPSTPPRRQAKRNEIAVDAACDLLVWWEQPVVTTRDGKAEQLARILAGNLTVDLFDHLRKAKRRRLCPTIGKVREPKGIVYQTRRR